jgi:hypothetical protein
MNELGGKLGVKGSLVRTFLRTFGWTSGGVISSVEGADSFLLGGGFDAFSDQRSVAWAGARKVGRSHHLGTAWLKLAGGGGGRLDFREVPGDWGDPWSLAKWLRPGP